MPVRSILLFLVLAGLAAIPAASGSDLDIASAAAPTGWFTVVVPGITSESAPAPAPTPTPILDHGLMIRIDMDMFNGDRITRFSGLVQVDLVPAVHTNQIKVPGRYNVGENPSESGCTWTQVHTDTDFTATIFWSSDVAPPTLLVSFDWPHWQDWVDCPNDDSGPLLVAAAYPIEFHAEEAMGGFGDHVLHWRYRFPLSASSGTSDLTHLARYYLVEGAHTDATVTIYYLQP